MPDRVLERVVWEKRCACRATATSGALAVATFFNPETQSFHIRASLSAGPVCDACAMPWAPVERCKAAR